MDAHEPEAAFSEGSDEALEGALSVAISDDFVVSAASIESDAVYEKVWGAVDLVQSFPEIGSRNVTRLASLRVGKGARRYIVPPFVILYAYDERKRRVEIAELIPMRAAR